MSKLGWALVLGFIAFLIIPFPLNFIVCVIIGAIMPWTGDNKTEKKDVDR